MTMPDFKEWASTVKLSRFHDAIEHALKEAFKQGRYLGKREQESLWWEEQDKCLGSSSFTTEPIGLGNNSQPFPKELYDRIATLVKDVKFEIASPIPSCMGAVSQEEVTRAADKVINKYQQALSNLAKQ